MLAHARLLEQFGPVPVMALARRFRSPDGAQGYPSRSGEQCCSETFLLVVISKNR